MTENAQDPVRMRMNTAGLRSRKQKKLAMKKMRKMAAVGDTTYVGAGKID